MISGRYLPATIYWFRGLEGGGFGVRAVLQEEAEAVPKRFSMSTANLADLDGDGLQDLVIGDAKGGVLWSRNLGTATSPKFGPRDALKVGDQDLRVSLKSDPIAVDWDGDGKLDLLVGDECSDVVFFRGLGKLEFAPGVSLWTQQWIDPKTGYQAAKKALEPHRVIPGYRLRVHTADWNGDGKLDLLLGNVERGKDGVTGNVYVLLRQ